MLAYLIVRCEFVLETAVDMSHILKCLQKLRAKQRERERESSQEKELNSIGEQSLNIN